MTVSWWDLPGPSQFVARLVRYLQDGSNVVALLPDYLPNGLAEAVARACGLPGGYWLALHLDEKPLACDPVEWLYAQVSLTSSDDGVRSAESLAAHSEFAGMTLWIDGMTPGLWPVWNHFLAVYQHACRGLPHDNRTLLCLSLQGVLAMDEPQADVCLAVVRWDDVITELDMAIYASACCPDRYRHRVRRDVAVATAAGLALWDPEVAERLLTELDCVHADPTPVLSDIARGRGWPTVHDNGDQRQRWARGMAQRVGGKVRLHSAMVTIQADAAEMRRRLWRAQLREILPYIEEERCALLNRYRDVLHAPWLDEDTGRLVERRSDLEISQIRKQMKDQGLYHIRVDGRMRERIEHLCRARNNLAHMQPLDGDLLLDDGWLW